MRSVLRIFIGTLATILGLVLIAIVSIYLLFWSSLPTYDGQLTSAYISESLTIERDDLGVPLVKADSRETVTFGIGYCHGQDRFFQMDLQRRIAAGELSALFGNATLDTDKSARIHGFRQRAQFIRESLSEEEKTILEYYTRGVNEGLASLKTRPPEYWLFQTKPVPWKSEDSLLVIFAFYLDLQNNPDLDYALWAGEEYLPLLPGIARHRMTIRPQKSGLTL